jgi:hypothetical protein
MGLLRTNVETQPYDGLKMAKVYVYYDNEVQETPADCWAAVAANVFNSAIAHWPPGTPLPTKYPAPVTQGYVASLAGKSTSDEWNVLTPLWQLKMFEPGDLGNLGCNPEFDLAMNELTEDGTVSGYNPSGEPVVAELCDGGYHFVAISGLDPKTRHVWIEDPALGPHNCVEYTAEEFFGAYGASTSGGIVAAFWTVARVPQDGSL